ncbi:amino acid/polyamine transporter [Phytophthora sojae]|uniref:Amino acid/polyamine transporter n=1 Tax=Phytophthora sojae (strain P6497) TaxID=1094619 RepID=G4YFG4_PHYSP|nr:amino acid/polyamine transporter [Phytophthora sojae]EGZ26949.1 amino acid/polyamine transporter [Phytophthora sojae]|eukprot:XP_009514224.1 amino acid/polyamine transporter [Phytophthora sojae]
MSTNSSVNGPVIEGEGPKRYAKTPHLWALGVGAVISGDFFGWQAALVAGFDGLLILLAVVTVQYVLLSFSIAELSATVPHGGGPYVFALHGIGKTAAFFAGIAECLKVVVTTGVAATGIGSYFAEIIGVSSDFGPIWWIACYLIFVTLNVMGVEMTFRVQAAATAMSTTKNMPRGLVTSIITLIAISFCTVIFNSMISPGADEMYANASPLLEGYKTVFGDNSTTSGFTWILIVGLISSFHSFVFCMGKQAALHPTRGTTYVALITGSIIALVLVIVLHFAIGDNRLGSVLINLALIGAIVSYLFQLTAFVMLRIREPERPRPYKSPFGIPGAVVCIILCIFSLVSIIYSGTSSWVFLASVLVAIGYFIIGAVYFVYRVKPRLEVGNGPVSAKEFRENLMSSRVSNKV